MTDVTPVLRLEVQSARNDVFVWNVSTWTGYRWAGPADTAESGIEWRNILGTSHDIQVTRGAKRDGLSLALEPGLMSAMVNDSTVDPNVNPYVKMGTPIRLVYNAGLGDVALFTGVIKTVKVTYKAGKSRVFITAVDRVRDLANINRSGVVSGTFSERVGDLLGKHGIPHEVSGSSSLVLAQNAYDSTLLKHLQLAANTERGYVFVDKENTVQAVGALGPTLPTYTNMMSNPSVETDTTGWTGNGVTMSRSNTWAASGTWSIYTAPNTDSNSDTYVVADGGLGGMRNGMVAGGTYTVSATVHVPTALTGGYYDSRRVRIVVFYLEGGVYHEVASTRGPVDGGTERLSLTFTIPSGATEAFIRLYNGYLNTATNAVFWDAVMLTQGSTLRDYVDTTGVLTSSVTFTDQMAILPEDIEYVDIAVAYDSEAMSNDIYVNNLTWALNEELEPISVNTKYGPFRNVTSIVTFGAYSQEVETNFETEAEVTAFAADVLAAHDAPELRVDSVRFNAKDYMEVAADIEVFDSVNVEYNTESVHIEDTFKVLSLTHTITASNDDHKWMVDVDLLKEETS